MSQLWEQFVKNKSQFLDIVTIMKNGHNSEKLSHSKHFFFSDAETGFHANFFFPVYHFLSISAAVNVNQLCCMMKPYNHIIIRTQRAG